MDKLKKSLAKLSTDIESLDLSNKNIDDIAEILPLLAKLTNLAEVIDGVIVLVLWRFRVIYWEFN